MGPLTHKALTDAGYLTEAGHRNIYTMPAAAKQFTVRQVTNGWVVQFMGPGGNQLEEAVATSLAGVTKLIKIHTVTNRLKS